MKGLWPDISAPGGPLGSVPRPSKREYNSLIDGSLQSLKPRQTLTVGFARPDGSTGSFETLCRIDTENEVDYFYAGGILPYVLRQLLS